MLATIRSLTADDHDALLALWNAAGLPCKPEGRDARSASSSNSRCRRSGTSERSRRTDWQAPRLRLTMVERAGSTASLFIPIIAGKASAPSWCTLVKAWLETCGIGIFACLIEGWNETSRQLVRANGYDLFEGVSYFTKRTRPTFEAATLTASASLAYPRDSHQGKGQA